MVGARRRRVLTGFGLVSVLAGLALVGYVAWAVYGTTWLAQRTQADVVDELEAGWAAGAGTPEDEDASVEVPAGRATALLRVPRFGDAYVVPVLEGTSDEVLAAGVGHVEETAGPGEEGNYALAGHRITRGEPFRRLPDLAVGDLVEVETATHRYTYEMLTGGADLTVTFQASWVLDPLPDNPEPGGVEPPQEPGQQLLTLTTCADLFHSDDRLVAFGTLVGTERKDR